MATAEIDPGGCPVCRSATGYVVVDGAFWMLCDPHELRWIIPAWDRKSYTAEEIATDDEIRTLGKFKQVEPWYPPMTAALLSQASVELAAELERNRPMAGVR